MAIEIVKVIDYKIFLVIFTDYIRGKLSAYLVEIHGSHLFRIYFSIRGGIRILAHCAAGAPGVRRGYKKLKSTWVNGSNFTWRCWTQVRDPKNRKQKRREEILEVAEVVDEGGIIEVSVRKVYSQTECSIG